MYNHHTNVQPQEYFYAQKIDRIRSNEGEFVEFTIMYALSLTFLSSLSLFFSSLFYLFSVDDEIRYLKRSKISFSDRTRHFYKHNNDNKNGKAPKETCNANVCLSMVYWQTTSAASKIKTYTRAISREIEAYNLQFT